MKFISASIQISNRANLGKKRLIAVALHFNGLAGTGAGAATTLLAGGRLYLNDDRTGFLKIAVCASGLDLEAQVGGLLEALIQEP